MKPLSYDILGYLFLLRLPTRLILLIVSLIVNQTANALNFSKTAYQSDFYVIIFCVCVMHVIEFDFFFFTMISAPGRGRETKIYRLESFVLL